LAAFETLHSMQTRMWSKTGFMGFKLDMNKAYNRVEWPFLEAVMRKLGFVEQWIKLIMACVTQSPTLSLLMEVRWEIFSHQEGFAKGIPFPTTFY